MSAADCERWENRLLDLAYGEIEESDEREVRAHLDGCEHCRSSLTRLSRGRALARHLEQAEPPADAMQVVLRAARDRALEIQAAQAAVQAQAKVEAEATSAVPKAEAAPRAESWWTAVLSVVMAPQFAMATLLLLTVGVGLWWFPNGREGGGATPPLLSEPTVATGPEALAPADPIRFDVDPRTGRVEAHRDEAELAEAERPRGIRPGPRVGDTEESDETAAAIATLHMEDGESAGIVVDGVLPDTADGTGDIPALMLDVAPGSTERAVAEAPVVAPGRPTMPELGPRTEARAYGAEVAPSEAPMPEELERTTPSGDTVVAAGLLRNARELARAGRHAEAIVQYERVLGTYRSAVDAGAAMMELAESYRRTGAIDRARSWLERATAIPSVAAAARRELIRLDATPEVSDRATAAEESY